MSYYWIDDDGNEEEPQHNTYCKCDRCLLEHREKTLDELEPYEG